jgi:hypothetical protein
MSNKKISINKWKLNEKNIILQNRVNFLEQEIVLEKKKHNCCFLFIKYLFF